MLFVTLSSVAVLRQKGRSRVNKCFMRLIWTLGNQDKPMIALVLQRTPKILSLAIIFLSFWDNFLICKDNNKKISNNNL